MGTMEALFRPSSHVRDLHRNHRGILPEDHTEVELLPPENLTIEDVLATGATWDDFRLFLSEESHGLQHASMFVLSICLVWAMYMPFCLEVSMKPCCLSSM
jgi:hypothetical protein